MSINKLKAEKILQFNDVEYKARMSIDTIVRIEQALGGTSILYIASTLSEAKLTLTEMIQIITLAIRSGGNDVKEKDIKKLVSDIGIVSAVQMVTELITLALDVPEDDMEEKKSEEQK